MARTFEIGALADQVAGGNERDLCNRLGKPCKGFAESGPHGTWVAERLRRIAWTQ